MPETTTATTKKALTKKKSPTVKKGRFNALSNETIAVTLSAADRKYFRSVIDDATAPPRAQHRARILMQLAEGATLRDLRKTIGASEFTCQGAVDRFHEYGREAIMFAVFNNGKPVTYEQVAARKQAQSVGHSTEKTGVDKRMGVILPENRLKRSDQPLSRFPWKLGCSTIVGGERELTKVCDGIPDKQLYDMSDAWWDDKRGEGRIAGSRKRYRSRAQFTADLAAKSRKTIVFGYEPRWMGVRFFWVGAGSVQKVLYQEAKVESEKKSDVKPADKRWTEEQTFIDRCRHIAHVQGKTNVMLARNASVGWGLEEEGARVYDDEHITIVAEAEPSLSMLVVRKKNRNPVVCTDKKGDAFRWHGEWHHLNDHVAVVHG